MIQSYIKPPLRSVSVRSNGCGQTEYKTSPRNHANSLTQACGSRSRSPVWRALLRALGATHEAPNPQCMYPFLHTSYNLTRQSAVSMFWDTSGSAPFRIIADWCRANRGEHHVHFDFQTTFRPRESIYPLCPFLFRFLDTARSLAATFRLRPVLASQAFPKSATYRAPQRCESMASESRSTHGFDPVILLARLMHSLAHDCSY